ncbi:hypothetical protein CASFOL_035926 [Castilleja foliolosa]|uniref:Protein kinase domain-containing protein n=1 Tax=Castilleja foliolosa TaxID=1961234 RepID=A0ABD3BUP2_9LAMI
MSTRNNPIIFFFISFLVPSSYSLSFNLSTIGPEHQGRFINVTGDAYITNQGIQVTPNECGVAPTYQTGRATYTDPLHLWDRASGNLTDFTARFSFVIDSSGNNIFADGLTFFLGPVGSSIQPWSYGGSLGIGNSTVSLNSSAYSFVAIEFNTFRNFFDSSTPGPHIGIDINSMESVNATIWQNNVTLGVQNDAWISYWSIGKHDVARYVGLSVVVFGVTLASYCLWWRKKYKKRLSDRDDEEEDHPDIDMEFEKGSGAKKFCYNELVITTTNFSNEGKLGEGGFGGVYKGFLRETDSYIAVKRVSKGSKQGLKEYASEVKIISQLRHRNLVQVFGFLVFSESKSTPGIGPT